MLNLTFFTIFFFFSKSITNAKSLLFILIISLEKNFLVYLCVDNLLASIRATVVLKNKREKMKMLRKLRSLSKKFVELEISLLNLSRYVKISVFLTLLVRNLNLSEWSFFKTREIIQLSLAMFKVTWQISVIRLILDSICSQRAAG